MESAFAAEMYGGSAVLSTLMLFCIPERRTSAVLTGFTHGSEILVFLFTAASLDTLSFGSMTRLSFVTYTVTGTAHFIYREKL